MQRYTAEKEKWIKIMNSNDSKEIWDGIRWKCKDVNNETEKPSPIDLANQFKMKDGGIDDVLLTLEYGNRYVEELDCEISLEEVSSASNKLKEGKVTSDGWSSNMVKYVSNKLFPILVIIFNIMLSSKLFPVKWFNGDSNI